MNSSRLKVLRNGVTGIAKKILDCVPIMGTASPKEIMTELHRMGTRTDPKIVDGCLMSLLDTGVIRQPQTNRFQQVTSKEKEPMSNTATATTGKPADATHDRLAFLASSLRSIANEMDDIALSLQSDDGAEKEELKQLRALKVMLSGLAGK